MNASRMKASQWSKREMTFLKPRPASQPMTGIRVWNKPKSESQAQRLAQLDLPGGAAAGHGHGHGVHGQAQGDEQDRSQSIWIICGSTSSRNCRESER